MEKAQRLYPAIQWDYDAEHHWWRIRSSSGNEWYALFKYQGKVAEDAKFWQRVGCTCPAQDSVLPICYHKAWLALFLSQGGNR